MGNLEQVSKVVMALTSLALVVTLVAVALEQMQMVGWGLAVFLLLLILLGQVDHRSTVLHRQERERQAAQDERASQVRQKHVR